MKKSYLKILSAVLLGATTVFVSCKKDEETTTDPQPQEYVANDDSFKDIMSWTLAAEPMGIDPALGAAHGGNDSTVVRSIYFKDDAKPVNGEYPVGTVIVKHSHNEAGSVEMYTAMVKRRK